VLVKKNMVSVMWKSKPLPER